MPAGWLACQDGESGLCDGLSYCAGKHGCHPQLCETCVHKQWLGLEFCGVHQELLQQWLLGLGLAAVHQLKPAFIPSIYQLLDNLDHTLLFWV